MAFDAWRHARQPLPDDPPGPLDDLHPALRATLLAALQRHEQSIRHLLDRRVEARLSPAQVARAELEVANCRALREMASPGS